jgi:superfamily II DNA or RNA helicase
MRAGDYTEESMEDVVAESNINELEIIKEHGIGSTIIMCRSIEHAQKLFDEMQQQGLSVGILTSENKTDDLERFRNGEIKYILSIMMISVGTDLPIAQTAISLRPIASMSLIDQFIGRVLRLYENKSISYFIDVYGSIENMERFPFETPTPKEPKSRKKMVCEACECDRDETLIDQEMNEKFIITKKMQCNNCNNIRLVEYKAETAKCPTCKTLQVADKQYRVKNDILHDCVECKTPIVIATLQNPSLIVNYGNIDNAINLIMHLSNNTLEKKKVEEFVEFATFDQISFLIDVLETLATSTHNKPKTKC